MQDVKGFISKRNEAVGLFAVSCVLFGLIFLLTQNGWAQLENWPGPKPVEKELTVYWTDKAPEVDGVLDDAMWQNMPRITGLMDIGFRHSYVPDQTLFAVCYDAENIYIAIDCRERFPNLMKVTAVQRDGNLWEGGGETLEIFFDAQRSAASYIQIVLNPVGSQWDFRRDDSKPVFTQWNGAWKYAAQRTETGWRAEVVVPFTDLRTKTPEPGFRLRANLCRGRNWDPSGVYSSWSVLSGSFHKVSEFGDWVFADPRTKFTRDDETKTNQEFIAAEKTKLMAFPRRVKHEADLLEGMKRGDIPLSVTEGMQRIQEEKVKLSTQLENMNTLDGFLNARLTAVALEKKLDNINLDMSLRGLAGRVDGLKMEKSGITRRGSYWMLVDKRAVYAIAADSGCLAGIWDRRIQRQVVASSTDLYHLETMDDELHTDERFDKVASIQRSNSSITFMCTNPNLPGLTIKKEYQLTEQGKVLIKRIHVSAKVTEKTVLSVTSNTIFNPQFREESLYNRTFSAGASFGSDPRASIPATQISDKIIRQNGGGNKDCGYAQFVLANLKTGSGIAQYLHKINGQYAWVPYAMPGSNWNASGWKMSFLGTFLSESPYSSEMRYHLFDGDQVEFYHEYLALPDVKAAREELPVHPDIARLRYVGVGEQVTAAQRADFPDSSPRIKAPYERLRSDEIMANYAIPRHSIFSYWPYADKDELIYINRHTQRKTTFSASKARQLAERVRKIFPKYRMFLYWVHTDWHPDSDAFRRHPEFVMTLKNGNGKDSTHPYGARESDMSPAFTDYVVPQYAKMVDYFGLGCFYLDFYGGYSAPDWQDGRVTQTTDFMYFDKSLREMLQQRNAFLWFNGNPGHLYCDINYIESIPGMQALNALGKGWWRGQHERLMYYKLFERQNMISVPISWQGYRQGTEKQLKDNNEREYTNAVLALGFKSYACFYQYDLELKRKDGTIDWSRMYNYAEAYHQATLEMHDTRLASVDIEPAYWRDLQTPIEAYVLQKGPAYFFTTINHADTVQDVTLSADRIKLGFEKGKRLFRWYYTRRDDTKISRLIGPETPGWDRLFTKITCESSLVDNEERIQVVFAKAEVNYTYLTTLTQVPGVYVSKEGQETQFRLPDTLRCTLDGTVDEKRRQVQLKAAAVTPAVVAAWWPDEYGEAAVKVNRRKQENLEYIHYGRERFVLVPVERGASKIVVSANND